MEKQNLPTAFKNAFNGVRYFFLHERNGKVQLIVAAAVIIFSVGLGITKTEWIYVLLCIVMVLGLEMMNSAIEKLCDVVQEEYHPVIKRIKDVAAGAVLLGAMASLIIGAAIFLPRISKLTQ